TPFVIGGAVVVFMILVGVIMTSGGGDDRAANTETKAPEKVVEIGERNPRVRDAMAWVDALGGDGSFQLATLSDVPALATFLGVDTEGTAGNERDERVLAALRSDERTAFLRDAEATGGRIEPEHAESTTGEVRVFLAVRDEHGKKWTRPNGEIDVTFRMDGERVKVTGWDALFVPEVVKPRGPRAVEHDVIGKAQNVERVYDGKVETVREAEL